MNIKAKFGHKGLCIRHPVSTKFTMNDTWDQLAIVTCWNLMLLYHEQMLLVFAPEQDAKAVEYHSYFPEINVLSSKEFSTDIQVRD